MSDNLLDEIISDHRALHSEYQMDHFITGSNNATPYAMYRQALREFTSRVSGLNHLYLEEQRKEIDLAEALRGPWRCPWHSRARVSREELDIIEKRMVAQNARYAIRESERELVRFYAHCVVLKGIVGRLTEKRRAELDAEWWIQSVKCRAAAEVVSQRSVSRGTVEMLASMPVDVRKRLWVEIFDDQPGLVQWYVNFEPVDLESQVLKVLEEPAEVRRMLDSVKSWQPPSMTSAGDEKRPKTSEIMPAVVGLTS